MKKWICFVLLICLSIAVCGCTEDVDIPTTTIDQVATLIDAGNYEDALALMEENPQQYGDLYDEARFFVAQTAVENKDYAYAATLLENNAYDGASALLEEANYHLAGQYMEQGEYEAAVACLENNTFEGAERLLKEAKYHFARILLEAEDYERAIPLLEDNSYMYAGTLLKEARNLAAAIQIEAYYREILTQISNDHPGTVYYTQLCDLLDETYTMLEQDGLTDRVKENFAEIFGPEPLTVAGAKEDMDRLQRDLANEYFYDTPYIPYVVMDYLIEIWGRPSGYTHFEMTDTKGSMIIDQPNEYLIKASISPKTMAKLLASLYETGAQVTRDGSKIAISFEKYQPNGEYSRGYYHCAPDSQEQEIEGFFLGMRFENYDAYLDYDGLHVTVTFTPSTRYYLQYLSVELFLINTEGNIVAGTGQLLENVSDNTITLTVLFEGVNDQDLPGGQYMMWYYLAAVMNN